MLSSRGNLAPHHLGNIWRAYRASRLIDRLRPVGRYLLCPFGPVIDAFPKTGRILDVGCGDGLLLQLLNSDPEGHTRELTGIDPAANKIANAKRLNDGTITFLCAEISSVSSDSFDCVSIVDVLYLLPLEKWADFLHHGVRSLKPNGLLIIKEVIDRPRWKFLIAYMEEILAISVIGMTKGDHPHFESVDTYSRFIQAAGADVLQVKRLDGGRPHAHVMFLARKR